MALLCLRERWIRSFNVAGRGLFFPASGEEENEEGVEFESAEDHFETEEQFCRWCHPGEGKTGADFPESGSDIGEAGDGGAECSPESASGTAESQEHGEDREKEDEESAETDGSLNG